MSATDPRRQAAFRLGERAEWRAAGLLRLKGYRLIVRRFRCPLGEIDLVMRRGRTIVFVEVKARETEAEGLEAVAPRAQRRIAAAAGAFLAGRPEFEGFDCRFDVVVVAPRRLPMHLANAFTADA